MLSDAPLKSFGQRNQRLAPCDITAEIAEGEFGIRLGQVKMCQPIHSHEQVNLERTRFTGPVLGATHFFSHCSRPSSSWAGAAARPRTSFFGDRRAARRADTSRNFVLPRAPF